MSSITYYIGEQRLVWERVRDENNEPITPTSAAASLVNRATGSSIETLTVIKSEGRIEATITTGRITTPGDYYIDWDYTYSKGTLTVTHTLITDIIATYRDSSSLMKLVKRMRVYIGDNPDNIEDRMYPGDESLKAFMVEAVRNYMGSYSTAYSISETSGYAEISPTLTAESDAEQLVVLYGAYLFLLFQAEAIAREQTTMFSIQYENAYNLLQDRLQKIWDLIAELDDNAAMPILDETDIVAWGLVLNRRSDSISEWDSV